MTVECIIVEYGKDGKNNTVIKVQDVPFNHEKVGLTIIDPDKGAVTVDVIAEELMSAIKRCELNWRGM